MNYTMYAIDEAAMPAEGDPSATPEGFVAAIRARGGRWASVKADPEAFADAFATLDDFVAGGGFLVDLAARGSPKHLLVGFPGDWRLGYFEASLVPHLDGAFRLLSDEIAAALESRGEATRAVARAFLSALEDAAPRRFAVAVIHG